MNWQNASKQYKARSLTNNIEVSLKFHQPTDFFLNQCPTQDSLHGLGLHIKFSRQNVNRECMKNFPGTIPHTTSIYKINNMIMASFSAEQIWVPFLSFLVICSSLFLFHRRIDFYLTEQSDRS